ncbi:MAG: LysM peptidoglycan-binding domain-containing protein [Anaerolineae bacterium]|nr:LysM peptidoglycan-binding domain-containing protein [Anaerolineae bacterium]
MNRLHAHTVLGMLLLGIIAIVPAAGAAPATQSAPAVEILSLVNQLRAEHGLPPYQFNGTLAIAAQNHANWMASTVTYSHTQDNGSTPQTRANAAGYNGFVSEIIVGGSNMSPAQGLIWWRNSSLHYSNMVSSRYSEAGAAFATSGSQNMYVIVIGRPANNPVPLAAAEPLPGALMVTPIRLAEPREDGSIVHTVAAGQALWQIAAHYEVELSHILLINSIDEDHVIQPGDEIYIRLAEGQPPPPTPTPPLSHLVREGENPWMIAVRYDVDLNTIFYLNGFDENVLLHPGEEVRVRLAPGEQPPPTATPRLHHIVREGETLWTVAALNNLTLDELLALNNLDVAAVLHVGDQLLIRPMPTPTETPSPTTAPATMTPTAAQRAASSPMATTVLATSTITPAPAVTATPQPEAEEGGGSFLSGPVIFALVILGGAAWLFSRGRI